MTMTRTLPDRIEDANHLEDWLSQPTDCASDALTRVDGDILILGAAGKMGPTLARMARRASDLAGVRRRVIAASRFSEPGLETKLNAWGVETIRCDLLDPGALAALPDSPNLIYMAGMKFGSAGQEAKTWAMNAFLPGLVANRFRRSRIVAFSTGNVYGLSPIALGGSRETDPLDPKGEYAFSCLGRERIFEHFSRECAVPTAILRLNYAVEMRYGVLADIGRKVADGQPVDLAMGCLNAVWQGDANAMALASLAVAESPPLVLNLAGPETLSVRRIAERFGELLGRPPQFQGEERPDALLSNGQKGHQLFGYPRVAVDRILIWTADWIRRGGETLGKPTKFEARDGRF